MRIGYGFDIHQFESGDGFTLGGVKITFNKKIIAHSDGDVLIHAICDALLGASALGDIGKHFPDTKSKFKNISSLILLKKVSTLLKENNFEISNIDSTIVLQSPKIISFVDEMRNKISSVLEIELNQISIKATTNENLDAIGNEKGIAAHAVALIFKK